jgi:hypothetical protein
MDEELERKISLKVFEDVGITIGAKDPIFALATICKEIIKEDKESYINLQQGIILEIRNIPDALTKALDKITSAVEESEKTAKALSESTQKDLKNQAGQILAETRKAINIFAKDQVAVALSQMDISFGALEQRAKNLGKDSGWRGVNWWVTTMLSAALLCCLTVFAPVTYFQVKKSNDLEHQVDVFARGFISLDRAVNTLPKATQENIKRLAEKEKAAL